MAERFTMTWLHRAVAVVAASLLVPSAAGLCAEWSAVTTTDGRRIVGTVTRTAKGMVVADGLRDVHVADAIVVRTEPVAAPPAPPTYELNRELVDGKKKGRIDPVVRNFDRGPPDAAGVAAVSLVDPKLGPLSFRMAVTRLTPTTYRLEGIEYRMLLEYPIASAGPFAARHAMESARPESVERTMHAARFLRMLGALEPARELLAWAERAAPDHRDVVEERRQQEAEPWQRTLAELRRLALSDRGQQARAAAEKMAIPATLEAVDPELHAALRQLVGDIRDEARVVAEVRAKLPHGLPADGTEPSGPQARRLARILALEPAVADDPTVVPLLAQEWVDAFPDPGPDAASLRDAVALATETANFFHAGESAAAPALAARYTESRLPLAVKVAIIRHARRFEPPPAAPAWEKIEYKHPRSKRAYHYFMQLPSSYRADTPAPVLVCLHGQVTEASVMNRYWGPTAERYGLVLVSPEYVYGREFGYQASQEEHEAVLGAVWHAAGGLNLDMDRVYLQGHSQGGHACWDIGGCHAGTFAGVLPILGAAREAARLANYRDTAVYAIDGSEDGGAPRINREAFQVMAELGVDATYVEYPGRGHEAFSEEYPAASHWMLAHVRSRRPRSLTLAASLPCGCRRRWLQVAPVKQAAGPPPVVRAAIEENRVTVEGAALRGLQLHLTSEVVDFGRPVEVVVNGHQAPPVRLEPDWKLALTTCLETRDRCDVPLARLPVGPR
jgi:predicted esterase